MAVDAPVGAQLQAGIGRWKNGDGITFAQPFSQAPVIVSAAQINGKPLLACAVNNAAGGFTLALYDRDGKPVTAGAWVQYIALLPTSGKAVYAGVEVQAGICQAGGGQHLGFPQAFSSNVAIVCSAQTSGKANAGAAMNNSPGGFDVIINDPQGQSVKRAWFQWLAIGI